MRRLLHRRGMASEKRQDKIEPILTMLKNSPTQRSPAGIDSFVKVTRRGKTLPSEADDKFIVNKGQIIDHSIHSFYRGMNRRSRTRIR